MLCKLLSCHDMVVGMPCWFNHQTAPVVVKMCGNELPGWSVVVQLPAGWVIGPTSCTV
jgi:hypothetical protein